MKIRFANIADLESIINIYNQAVKAGNATADLEELKSSGRIDWFFEHDNNSYPLYIMELNTKMIGWGSLSPYRKGRGALKNTAELSYYLDYSFHGKGFGKQLVDYIINDCKRLGIKNIFALLMEINLPSISLLKKSGFEQWGFMPGVVCINGNTSGHLIYGRKLTNSI